MLCHNVVDEEHDLVEYQRIGDGRLNFGLENVITEKSCDLKVCKKLKFKKKMKIKRYTHQHKKCVSDHFRTFSSSKFYSADSSPMSLIKCKLNLLKFYEALF